MLEKAFGGSAAEDRSELLLGGGEDLVVGVRGELARRGGVGVRAAKRTGAKHTRSFSSDNYPIWNDFTSDSIPV